jgi:hypothetical protein
MEPANKIEAATVTPEFIKDGVEDSSEAAAMLEPEIKLEIKGEPSDDSTTTEDTNIMEPEIKLEEGAVKLEIQEEPEDPGLIGKSLK